MTFECPLLITSYCDGRKIISAVEKLEGQDFEDAIEILEESDEVLSWAELQTRNIENSVKNPSLLKCKHVILSNVRSSVCG